MTLQTQWFRHPEAKAFILERLDQLLADAPPLRDFQTKLALHTNIRLPDWLDHLVLADGDAPRGQLEELGFELEDAPSEPGDTVYQHPGAAFVVQTRALGRGTQTPALRAAKV